MSKTIKRIHPALWVLILAVVGAGAVKGWAQMQGLGWTKTGSNLQVAITSTPGSANLRVGIGTPVNTMTDGDGDAYVTGFLEVAGVTYSYGAVVNTITAQTITSATTTLSAAGKRFDTLTTDSGTTIASITGGIKGQTLTLIGTSNTNYVYIADSTSRTLAGAWTGGAGDTLTLLETSVDGDEWTELCRSNN